MLTSKDCELILIKNLLKNMCFENIYTIFIWLYNAQIYVNFFANGKNLHIIMM